jgi:hypothetical protein
MYDTVLINKSLRPEFSLQLLSTRRSAARAGPGRLTLKRYKPTVSQRHHHVAAVAFLSGRQQRKTN